MIDSVTLSLIWVGIAIWFAIGAGFIWDFLTPPSRLGYFIWRGDRFVPDTRGRP